MADRFAAQLRDLVQQRGLTYRALAAHTHYSKTYVHALASGSKSPSVEVAERLGVVLQDGGVLVALAARADAAGDPAVDLAERVIAGDVSRETLGGLAAAVDDLAVDYSREPAGVLLAAIDGHLAAVRRLLDCRMTLRQHRQLVVSGAWLSLLAATCQIDLQHGARAATYLRTASTMAAEADHAELTAWCLETEAWAVLTTGAYADAIALSEAAQAAAPAGSSAAIQATAQEGRAWARMGDAKSTRRALDRVAQLVSPLHMPDRPEHHYRYDPGKALSYTATTLAWVGDPAAEYYAREVVRLLVEAPGPPRLRRTAIAQVDLAAALIAAGKPDEAADWTAVAVRSGRIVRSNWWRAVEVAVGVDRLGATTEAAELRELCNAMRPAGVSAIGGQRGTARI